MQIQGKSVLFCKCPYSFCTSTENITHLIDTTASQVFGASHRAVPGQAAPPRALAIVITLPIILHHGSHSPASFIQGRSLPESDREHQLLAAACILLHQLLSPPAPTRTVRLDTEATPTLWPYQLLLGDQSMGLPGTRQLTPKPFRLQVSFLTEEPRRKPGVRERALHDECWMILLTHSLRCLKKVLVARGSGGRPAPAGHPGQRSGFTTSTGNRGKSSYHQVDGGERQRA